MSPMLKEQIDRARDLGSQGAAIYAMENWEVDVCQQFPLSCPPPPPGESLDAKGIRRLVVNQEYGRQRCSRN